MAMGYFPQSKPHGYHGKPFNGSSTDKFLALNTWYPHLVSIFLAWPTEETGLTYTSLGVLPTLDCCHS